MGNNKRVVVEAPDAAPLVKSEDIYPPEQSEVIIEVKSCALNFADLLIMQGRYQANPTFPLTPGLEVAGIVHSVGTEVSDWRPGDRVVAQTDSGGLSAFVRVHSERLLALPGNVDFDVGSAFQIAYGTSYLALTRRARLTRGETLIVLGAAGGVGLTAVEIGKTLGARVIAVARSRERLALCRNAGAEITIDTSEVEDLRHELLSHGRAHVLYDSVGGPDGMAGQRALGPEGRHLLIGFASGDLPELKPNHLLVKNLDVIGVNWNQYIKERPELVRETLSELLELIAQGHISPHIGARYTLEEAEMAFDRLRSRDVTGKIVVTP